MIEFLDVKEDNEIKTLSELAFEIWHEYWTVILDEAQISYMVEKFQSYDAISRQIRNDNYTYKIIRYNGENAGYFGICPKNKKAWESPCDDINFDYLFLSKLYLKKGYRRKGIGAEAFSEIKRIAAEMGLGFIYLTVNKQNTNTIKAYEKWGFETVESVVTQVGQGFVMDDYIMRYPIHQKQ